MKLVQWLARGFHGGRIIEPGEQMLVDDSVVIGPHMLDIATGLRGGQEPPPPPRSEFPDVAPIPPILSLMAKLGAEYPKAIAPDGRLLVFNAEHSGYEYDRPAGWLPAPVAEETPPPAVAEAPPVEPPPAETAPPVADPAEAAPPVAADTPEAAAARQGAAVGETTGEVGAGETASPPPGAETPAADAAPAEPHE